MLIVTDDFATRSETTIAASAEVATMPASELKVLQPSKRWRTTTIANTPWIEADLHANGVVALGYDVVAVIGYDGSTSRNWHRAALDFNVSDWTRTNVASSNFFHVAVPPTGPAIAPAEIVATALADTFLEQVFTKPGKSSDLNATALVLRTAVIVRQNDVVDDIDLRIIAYSTITTQEARADFDIGAGTAGSGSAAGAFTVQSTSITSLGSGFYLCALNYTTDTADGLTIRLQLLTGAGATAIPLGDTFIVAAPATMLQTVETVIGEHPVSDHDGSGPMFQVRIGSNLTTTETTAARSGWLHAAQRNMLKDFSRFGFYHQFAATRSEKDVRVELWDPYNDNAYIEAGRMIVGKAVDFSGEIRSITHLIKEVGGQQFADGGEEYRPQNTIQDGLHIELIYMTKAQAMDDIMRMQRVKGRSQQILVIAPERVASGEQARYTQELMIYGYIDKLQPVPIASPKFPDHWMWSFDIYRSQ